MKICSPSAVLSFTFTYQNMTIETDMCPNADFASVKRHRSSIGATANVVFTVGLADPRLIAGRFIPDTFRSLLADAKTSPTRFF